jgi:iron(III) transport system substrate-binding protein
MPSPRPVLAVVAIALIAQLLGTAGCRQRTAPPAPTLVLYCATDREIAQDLMDQFERETGITIGAKFDTESAKAVGLVQEIRQEKPRPQCDVLWGGGPLFATLVANDGCLAAAPPEVIAAEGATAPHDPRGRWLGFAGVYRVLIVNTDVLPDPAKRPHSYRDLTDPQYRGHIGIANPLFGGMAAHVAALFATIGEPATRQWLAGLRDNHCALCAGMADVKNRVASGELWFGITSTVDAHVALVGGKPVTVVYPDQAAGEIGCLNGYNSVAMVAGAPHPQQAAAFLRFLLRSQTERLLAAGPGQNIGMLPASVAAHVKPDWIPDHIHTMAVDWSVAAAAHPAAQRAVKEILLTP